MRSQTEADIEQTARAGLLGEREHALVAAARQIGAVLRQTPGRASDSAACPPRRRRR